MLQSSYCSKDALSLCHTISTIASNCWCNICNATAVHLGQWEVGVPGPSSGLPHDLYSLVYWCCLFVYCCCAANGKKVSPGPGQSLPPPSCPVANPHLLHHPPSHPIPVARVSYNGRGGWVDLTKDSRPPSLATSVLLICSFN